MSKKLLVANRQNAKHSTGPRTARGKAIASQNALKHGLTAEIAVLPDEDPEDFIALSQRVTAELLPKGEIEAALVILIARKLWRLGRVARIEAATLKWEYFGALLERAQRNVALYEEDDLSYISGYRVTDEDAHEAARRRCQDLVEERDHGLPTCGIAFRQDAVRDDVLAKLTKYETELENSLYKALATLQALQDGRVESDG
jgi:hypothetical protein